MLKFSTTIKFINMLNKMGFSLQADVDAKPEELGFKIIENIIYKIPLAQDEFLEVINEISGKEFTKDSDTIEIIAELREKGTEIVKLFTQALKLNV